MDSIFAASVIPPAWWLRALPEIPFADALLGPHRGVPHLFRSIISIDHTLLDCSDTDWPMAVLHGRL